MDNSEIAFHAAERVLNLVENNSIEETKKEYSKIIVFHSTKHHILPDVMPITVPSAFGASYAVPSVDYRKIEEDYKFHGKKILDKTREIFKKRNIDIETRLITEEKPEDYIERIVEEEDFDLVVLGSKGEHSKLEQIFSGSIVERAINEVHCDILIVR